MVTNLWWPLKWLKLAQLSESCSTMLANLLCLNLHVFSCLHHILLSHLLTWQYLTLLSVTRHKPVGWWRQAYHAFQMWLNLTLLSLTRHKPEGSWRQITILLMRFHLSCSTFCNWTQSCSVIVTNLPCLLMWLYLVPPSVIWTCNHGFVYWLLLQNHKGKIRGMRPSFSCKTLTQN